MAIYTAPRAVLPIFNSSDFVVVKKGTSTYTFQYWLNQFQTINDQLNAFVSQLQNIGTAYKSTTSTSATATNGQTSTVAVITPESPTGTSPFPMAIHTCGLLITTNNTNINMQYGINNANIACNVHGNVNTKNYQAMFCCAFTYEVGGTIYIYQTGGGNTAQVISAPVYSVFIK